MAVNKGCRPDPRSMPQSKEFDEGFDRVFGKKRPKARGRFVWNPKTRTMEPISAGWVNPDSDRVPVYTDLYMAGTVTYDTKEDIGTRKKRKAYMERHGLVDPQDTVKMKAKIREEWGQTLRGENPKVLKECRETFARNLYQIESRKRRTR